MLDNIDIKNVLFLDIETVAQVFEYDNLDPAVRSLWNSKFAYLEGGDTSPKDQYKKAGVYAEFAKVVCITVGMFANKQFRLRSFAGHDEKMLLQEFADMLNSHFNREEHLLCAHNGKEFDFPFMARRMLINGVRLPKLLDIAGKKPWEVKHLDTMELWKFGDYKSYTSLNLLASIFGIPTPKDDIQGSDVGRVYWQDNDLERIEKYCRKDVLTVAQLFCRFKCLPLIEDKDVVVSEK